MLTRKSLSGLRFGPLYIGSKYARAKFPLLAGGFAHFSPAKTRLFLLTQHTQAGITLRLQKHWFQLGEPKSGSRPDPSADSLRRSALTLQKETTGGV